MIERMNKLIEIKNSILVEGGTVIWIKNENKSLSRALINECAENLLKLINDIKKNPRPVGQRFIEMEIE